jgi:predicted type IV restriction endonuclease
MSRANQPRENMDFADQLLKIAAKIAGQLPHLATEEATKNALILPVINALGYNVFDPLEVIPEFVSDVGTKKGEKVDFVITMNAAPIILMECKAAGAKLHLNHASQLYRYFAVTDARFAILTNGIEYRVYTDIENANKMDEKPFFEFSMLSLDARTIEEFAKFSKDAFNLENILSTASELKYKKQIQAVIAQELEMPSDEFVRHFAKAVYGGQLTAAVKSRFAQLVGDAFRDFVRSRVNQRIQSALEGTTPDEAPSDTAKAEGESGDAERESGIVTTQDEIEGFNIVRAILAKHVAPSRVIMRDTKSYCGILLDDNNRKPICRLHFNGPKKYLGLLDSEKKEERFALESLTNLFDYEDRLVGAAELYK